jgi:hypothetical protein
LATPGAFASADQDTLHQCQEWRQEFASASFERTGIPTTELQVRTYQVEKKPMAEFPQSAASRQAIHDAVRTYLTSQILEGKTVDRDQSEYEYDTYAERAQKKLPEAMKRAVHDIVGECLASSQQSSKT